MACRMLATAVAAPLWATTAPAAEPPSVDDITWHNIESYCTFTRADHTFAYDNPETWRFVFFTNYPDEADPDPFATGFMRIDGKLREFRLVSQDGDVKAGQTIVLRTSDADPVTATVRLEPGAEGYESTGYSGEIEVMRAGQAAKIAIKGDCGV